MSHEGGGCMGGEMGGGCMGGMGGGHHMKMYVSIQSRLFHWYTR